MTAAVLRRCKCGDPMNDKGRCFHCDTGACNTNHTAAFPGGPHCTPKHNAETCPRCVTLAAWLPQPGDFDDLPNGYENNA